MFICYFITLDSQGHSEEQIDVHIASESGEEFTLLLTLNECVCQ